jgi:hypothetical protein
MRSAFFRRNVRLHDILFDNNGRGNADAGPKKKMAQFHLFSTSKACFFHYTEHVRPC